jgi:hypothetical protein
MSGEPSFSPPPVMEPDGDVEGDGRIVGLEVDTGAEDASTVRG